MERLGISHCDDPDFYHAGLVASQDVLAAVRFGASLPYVDKNRILLAGQSWGGIASLAAASQRPEGVIAVANMGGGHCGNPVRYPGKPRHPDRMAEAIGKYTQTINVPVLWHYAENDQFFSPHAARLWFEAFTQNGGKGKLVLQPSFGSDGHTVFVSWDGAKLWAPALVLNCIV
jgi:dienelactone hydrolase